MWRIFGGEGEDTKPNTRKLGLQLTADLLTPVMTARLFWNGDKHAPGTFGTVVS